LKDQSHGKKDNSGKTPTKQRPLAKIVFAAVDRRSRDAGDLGNDRQGAVPGRLHLGCREQPPATLVELAAYRLPPLSDTILVDHAEPFKESGR
jgi:hypothetical protein